MLTVIPPAKTPEEMFAEAMRNPAVRDRAARDPLFAARLRESFNRPMLSRGPNVNPQDPRTFRQPPVTSTFTALGVAPTSVSVADQIRAQRDGFLVADGAQVTGNYGTAIRKKVGGIAAPATPRVGSPSAFYPYPSDKMRTGAALAGNGVVASETRGLLPTTGFNPDAFVATRPDSLNRTLPMNVPVPMPRRRLPVSDTGLITSSPSEARRRNVATLLGLGAPPAVAKDPYVVTFKLGDEVTTVRITNYDMLLDFFGADKAYRTKNPKFAQSMYQMLQFFEEQPLEGMLPAERKAIEESGLKKTYYYTIEGAKTVIQALITNTILAKTIDFNSGELREILSVFGVNNANEAINKGLANLYGDKFRGILFALGGKLPLDLEKTGIREALIRYLYQKIWSADMSADIFNAVSSKLACQDAVLGASMATAITEMRKAEYAPGKTPKAAICPAAQQYIVPVDGGATTDAGTRDTSGPNMKVVGIGLAAAAVLVGLGVYAKTR